MKEIVILSSDKYQDAKYCNYGDCFILNTGAELFIYDCGSEEHANRVIDYMDRFGFKQAIVILSHNDADHFNGIPILIEHNRVSAIYTTLLLKQEHLDKILDRIDDDRKTRESVKRDILEEYDNIASLSGNNLYDIYLDNCDLPDELQIIGPELEYMLDAVAKNLDGREGNTVDKETAINATSIQLAVEICGHNLLLCGDCSFNAIENNVENFDIVQLPHHGKSEQAEKIFEEKISDVQTIYIVSDNTGSSNGGSDDLKTTGHIVHNTKTEGDIKIDNSFFSNNNPSTGRILHQ